MRSGLNLLHGLVGLTTVLALAACGDDSAGVGGGGGSSGTDGTGGTTVTGNPTSSSVTSTGTSPVGPQSSSTGQTCEVGQIFADPDVDACGATNCCEEMQACEADFTLCFSETENGTVLDVEKPDGEALGTCMEDAECFGETGNFATYCDSTIGFDLDALAETYGQDVADQVEEEITCFNDSGCCEFFDVCTDGGTDEQGCIDCLNSDTNGDYSRCEDANACSIEAGCGSLVFVPYCDSGIGSGSIEVGTCISENCCEEYTDCTGDGSDAAVQECLDCLNSEAGGELCDAAIACEAEFCNTEICDSGLVIENLELVACLTESCCTEFSDCTNNAASDDDVQACIDCFNAYDPEGSDPAGELCAGAIACEETNCGGGEGGGGTGGGGTGGAPGTGGGGGAGGA